MQSIDRAKLRKVKNLSEVRVVSSFVCVRGNEVFYNHETHETDLNSRPFLRTKERPDNSPFFFVCDAGEEFRAEPPNGLRFIERHLVINLAALKMARHATRLEDWFDFLFEVRFWTWLGG